MKLKIFKDLKIKNDFEGLDHDNPILDVEEYILPEELKQEAIKHWKSAQKERDKTDNQVVNLEYKGQQMFLEYFFNITKEDLK